MHGMRLSLLSLLRTSLSEETLVTNSLTHGGLLRWRVAQEASCFILSSELLTSGLLTSGLNSCLPCGHMFGMSCIKQWMEDRSRDK
ncbi:zinc finger, RING/FYVE/PHD-type containing protein, partial [Tanacetum coccineum]